MSGSLTLVPTPIGNLDDITIRALQCLRSCDTILCEDTRHSSKLLSHHGISNKLQSFHQHNEHKITPHLIKALAAGAHFALITDAGTPGISDPGFLLVRACVEAGISIICLPGATAFVPAIVGSGFPCEKFVYLGFPPQKKGRMTFWKNLRDEARTMVLYESPHRIGKALTEAAEHLGSERPACVVRELSKIHETYHRGTLASLALEAQSGIFKGEIVLVISALEKLTKPEEDE